MKYIFLSIHFVLCFSTYATESKDLDQLLKESRCISTRSKKGVVSYKCDGTLGAELEAQRNNRDFGGKLQTTQELQTYPKRLPSSVQNQARVTPNEEKIKSCLTSIYNNQIIHFKARGKYTTVSEDMGIDRNETCNGLYIYTNVANEREFKITAKFGKTIWTVDQKRTIQKMR